MRPRLARDVLPALPGGLGQRIERAAELYRVWDEVVGPELARRGSPVGIERGCLIVAVSEPVWMQELTLLGPDIVERFAARAPEFGIRALRCIYGDAATPQPVRRLPYHQVRRLRQQEGESE